MNEGKVRAQRPIDEKHLLISRKRTEGLILLTAQSRTCTDEYFSTTLSTGRFTTVNAPTAKSGGQYWKTLISGCIRFVWERGIRIP